MQKRISCIFLLSAILVLCFALPVRAAEEFKKVSDNRKGAVTVSSTPIYGEASAKSQTLKTLKFGEKVVIKTQSENWYEVKKGSLKGFMKKKSVVMYNSTKKHVALTFDDGPNAKTTKKVLNALEKNKCRATFFLVGSNITKSTGNLLKREKKLGCEIGNHSYSHPLLTKMSTSAIKKQFTKTNKKVYRRKCNRLPHPVWRQQKENIKRCRKPAYFLVCGYAGLEIQKYKTADFICEKTCQRRRCDSNA